LWSLVTSFPGYSVISDNPPLLSPPSSFPFIVSSFFFSVHTPELVLSLFFFLLHSLS
jgi:hypothetical protein